MKKFGFCLIFLAAGITVFAQATRYKPAVFTDTSRAARLQQALPIAVKLYETYADQNHFPGFAFGIVLDGTLLQSGAVGYTDVLQKTMATAQSCFRIASMSKSVTALAILQLRDAGKLRLDDPAYRYIPELKNINYLTTDAAPITVQNLLMHSAGFPEDNPWGDRQLADSDAELLKLVSGNPSFSTVPGVAYEYSNLAFALLGKIITNVAHQPYQQYITQHILQPLGMTHTYWEFEKVPAQQLAHGYRWLNNGWHEEALEHDGAYGAMGGLITTIDDFSKYMALQLSAWPPRDGAENPVLKRSSLREMQHPWTMRSLEPAYKFPDGRTCAVVTAYGYGLRWMQDCNGRIAVSHSGGLPGFGSHWQMMPDYGLAVVSFANLTYANAGTINQRVLDTLITLAGLQPRVLPASAILEQRKTELVKLLPDWNGATQSGLFAENFFKDYLIDSLRKEATTLFAAAGKIKRISKVKPLNNLRGSFVLEGETKNLEVRFTLTPENPPLLQEYQLGEAKKE